MGIRGPRLGHHVCSIEDLDTPEFSSIVDKEKRFTLVGFIGGPPCPDFSVAGKNRGRDGALGRLSKTYVDLICKNQPDFSCSKMSKAFTERISIENSLTNYASN